MRQLKFHYDLEAQIEFARLKLKVLEKLLSAVTRISLTQDPVGLVTCVKYFADSQRDVIVWEVTPRFAIDMEGRVLSKWFHADINWPEVTYEMTFISNICHKELKELHDHLDDVLAA